MVAKGGSGTCIGSIQLQFLANNGAKGDSGTCIGSMQLRSLANNGG